MKECILIVDDEKDIIKAIVRRILAKYDDIYDPLVCVDGYEALDFMRTKNPAIVILDICMRNLDGFSVCKKAMRDINMKKIPIIVSSGFLNEENKKYLQSIGIKYFIDKPYSMDRLFMYIDQVRSHQNLG